MKFKDLRKPKLFRLSTVLFLKLYTTLLMKVKVNSNRTLPHGPKIFAINHPTTIDPFIIYGMFPNARVLINSDVFKIRILGYIFRKLDHVPVHKDNGRLAYNRAKEVLSNGEDIILFPEGNISETVRKRTDYRSGLVRLALETGVPIIPIGININTDKIKRFKSKKTNSFTRLYFFNKYTINIGRSIKLKGNINNREFVKRKGRYLKDEIQKLSRK